jgi:nucleotide-binding universal stress UspA family protein
MTVARKGDVLGKIKKILVAMAATEYCQGIFDHAATLAEALDAQIIVVSVINARDIEAVRQVAAMGYEVDGQHYTAGVRAAREKDIDAIISRSSFSQKRVRTLFKVGNPVDELLKTVVEEEVDMVVMGIKGRTDFEHMFTGSVAEKIFRRCPATVVSYRDEAQAGKLKSRIHF